MAGGFVLHKRGENPNPNPLPEASQSLREHPPARLRAASRAHMKEQRSRATGTPRSSTGSWIALASQDPASATEQALALEPEERDAVLTEIIPELARTSIEHSLEACEAIEAPAHRGNSFAFVLSQLAASDPQAAFDRLVSTAEDPAVKPAIEKRVLPAIADHDPEAVATWIGSGQVSPAAVNDVTHATIQRWAQQDAPAAAAWLALFPDSDLRRNCMEATLRLWVEKNPEAAKSWIEGLTDDTFREDAEAAFKRIARTID